MKLYLPADKDDLTVLEGSPRECAEYMLTVEMFRSKNKSKDQSDMINVLLNSIANGKQDNQNGQDDQTVNGGNEH